MSLSEEAHRATDILAQHEMTNIQVHSDGVIGEEFAFLPVQI